MTWPEFIEAGWLSEYRQAKVALPELRTFVSLAREAFGVEYPLAMKQPLHSGRDLMAQVQDEAALPRSLQLVRYRDNQIALTDIASQFVRKVEFDVDATGASRYWPRGKDKLVVLDPLVNYGAPMVEGIRTDLLIEQIRAGGEIDGVAGDWGLPVESVKRAIEWEMWDPQAKTAA